jgi:hypothetical protein
MNVFHHCAVTRKKYLLKVEPLSPPASVKTAPAGLSTVAKCKKCGEEIGEFALKPKPEVFEVGDGNKPSDDVEIL